MLVFNEKGFLISNAYTKKMKKIILSIIACFITISISAQEFKKLYDVKANFKPDLGWIFSKDGKHLLLRGENQSALYSGENGTLTWELNYKEKLGVKSFDRVIENFDLQLIALFEKGSEKKGGIISVIDMKNGNEIYRVNNYPGSFESGKFNFIYNFARATKDFPFFPAFNTSNQKIEMIEAKTGKIKWSVAYSVSSISDFDLYTNSEDLIVLSTKIGKREYNFKFLNPENGEEVSYTGRKFRKNEGVKSFSLKNGSTLKLYYEYGLNMINGNDIIAELYNNGLVWRKEFKMNVAITVATDNFLFEVVENEKYITIVSQELKVFNKQSGENIYNQSFESIDYDGLLKQRVQISAIPILKDNFLYTVDLESTQTLRKIDLINGLVVWENKLFAKNDIAPVLLLAEGVLVVQTGGRINIQKKISTDNGTILKSFYSFEGEPNVIAVDENSGQKLWDGETIGKKLKDKFNDRITNIKLVDNQIYLATSKNIYVFEPKTGEAKSFIGLKDLKAGYPLDLLVLEEKDRSVLITQNGVIGFNKKPANAIYNSKIGEILDWEKQGQSFVLVTKQDKYFEVNEFVIFDLENGAVNGKMKCEYLPGFTEDGEYFYVRDDKNFSKFKVR